VHACAQVLLNILADEIHRAHQRCLTDATCDPNQTKRHLVFEVLWMQPGSDS
jgi:amidophosphoribosyltransferase